jgi:hypothetical protein
MEWELIQGRLSDLRWPSRPALPDSGFLRFLVQKGLISSGKDPGADFRNGESIQTRLAFLAHSGSGTREDLQAPFIQFLQEACQEARTFTRGRFTFEDHEGGTLDAHRFLKPVSLDGFYGQIAAVSEDVPVIRARVRKAVRRISENLYLIPSGKLPPNPSEILGSGRMRFLLQFVQREFDVVLIDSPPLLATSDALLLVSQADGVVLVVKSGQVNRELVQKAVEQLRVARANLLGVVLNEVEVKKTGYYRYYHKYYTHYYGGA